MRLTPRSLFGRNLLLLAVMVLLAQALAAAVFFVVVQKPRADETADMLSRNLVAVRDGLAALPAAARAGFVARFNAHALGATPAAAPSTDRDLAPAERLLVRSISRRLADQGIDAVWRREQGALFVRLSLDGAPYWLAAAGPDFGIRPRFAAVASWLLSLTIALAGALLLQRRINRPLAQLAGAARAIESGQPTAPLAEDGPTEIASLAAAFNRMQAALADRERSRALMLAGISHDLRTPLAKLRLSVELLGETPSAAPDPALLEGMATSCQRMDAIIGQFIDFARLADDAPLAPLALAPLVAEAVRACPGGEQVHIDLPEALTVLGHGPGLGRLLANLVDNALKHGQCPVQVSAHAEDGAVTVRVRDAGPGIDLAALARLRQPFARGSAARDGPAGTGLGLAIADQVARHHGGALRFAHLPDGGFEVALTLTRAP